jgi:hypothetical protein
VAEAEKRKGKTQIARKDQSAHRSVPRNPQKVGQGGFSSRIFEGMLKVI